jgi:hypothetical protein
VLEVAGERVVHLGVSDDGVQVVPARIGVSVKMLAELTIETRRALPAAENRKNFGCITEGAFDMQLWLQVVTKLPFAVFVPSTFRKRLCCDVR